MKQIKFTAFGQDWKIKFVKKHRKLSYNKKTKIQDVGYCDPLVNTIYIKTVTRAGEPIPDSAKVSCLLHELIELVTGQLDMKTPHEDINKLESGLFEVLVNNGWLNLPS